MSVLLRNLKLVYDLDRETMPTVAGLLIFGINPQRFLPQSRVSAVAFAGVNEDADILDRREISGRLPAIIEETRVFFDRNTYSAPPGLRSSIPD